MPDGPRVTPAALTQNERTLALEVAVREGGETRKWLNLVLEAYDALNAEREHLDRLLREVNAILDVGDDYDSMLLQRVFDWWQQKDGPRSLFEEGFVA